MWRSRPAAGRRLRRRRLVVGEQRDVRSDPASPRAPPGIARGRREEAKYCAVLAGGVDLERLRERLDARQQQAAGAVVTRPLLLLSRAARRPGGGCRHRCRGSSASRGTSVVSMSVHDGDALRRGDVRDVGAACIDLAGARQADDIVAGTATLPRHAQVRRRSACAVQRRVRPRHLGLQRGDAAAITSAAEQTIWPVRRAAPRRRPSRRRGEGVLERGDAGELLGHLLRWEDLRGGGGIALWKGVEQPLGTCLTSSSGRPNDRGS